MSTQFTEERYQAAHKMLKSGETIAYAACMFDIPLHMFNSWLAGLSVESITDIEENNTSGVITLGRAAELSMQDFKQAANKFFTQSHGTGYISSYVIVIVGNFVDGFKYHVTGNGFKLGDNIYNTYATAEGVARCMLMDNYPK